jgi:hypothetical protein
MSAANSKKSPKAPKRETYEATVMLRITSEFTERLDRAADLLATKERAFGRARKVGRATVVYEAMVLGLPLLEKDVSVKKGVTDDAAE